MSDLTQEQAQHASAPRVTQQDIESVIAFEYYATGDRAFADTTRVIGPAYKAIENADITPLACLTLCVLHLRNGFTVVGESACVDPANFDEAIGRRVARAKAVDKIWPLLGYQLKEQLHLKIQHAHQVTHTHATRF